MLECWHSAMFIVTHLYQMQNIVHPLSAIATDSLVLYMTSPCNVYQYCNLLSLCLFSVSCTCHALLDRFLEENFSDDPHHLDSENDSQSETCEVTHEPAHKQKINIPIIIYVISIIMITCSNLSNQQSEWILAWLEIGNKSREGSFKSV